MKKRHDIIAEQYLEVVSDEEGGWFVNLVIESLPQFINFGEHSLVHRLGVFRTMEEGDEFADSFRYLYDKTIFKYELM
jgi:hypothetical protein